MAQHPQPSFVQFSVDDGLPSSEIYDLLQDQAGYIWIATDNGVSRFNGYSFEKFGPEDGLKDNVVFSLQEDAQDRIWMSTYKGIYIYDRDSIRPFPYNHLILEYIKWKNSDFILSFFVDEEETFHGGIPKLGVVQIFSDGRHQLIEPAIDGNCLTLYQKSHQVLISYVNCHIVDTLNPWPTNLLHYQVDASNAITLQHPIKELKPLYSRQQKVEVLQSGNVLFSQGRYTYPMRQNQLLDLVQHPSDVIAQQQVENGGIYLGLYKQDHYGGVLFFSNEQSLQSDSAVTYLKDFSITTILEDRKKGMWFGTNANGIFYLTNPSVKIYNQAFGLADDFVTALTVKNEEEVFIGTNGGDTYLLNGSSQELTVLSPNTVEVFDLAYDTTTGWLWRGSHIGMQYYNGSSWHSVEVPDHGAIRGHKKFRIYPTGEIYGSSSGVYGFATYRTADGYLLYSTHGALHLNNRIFCTYKDFDGRLWVGQTDGLFEIISNERVVPDRIHPSFQLRVEEITQLADSTLVIGTKGAGVLLWRDTQLLQIDESKGLTANMIEKIHIDATQQIWVGTLNGLNRITRAEDGQVQVQRFTISDGLPSNEITEIASTKKVLWVATTKGLAQLPIQDLLPESPPSLPMIDQVIINKQPMKIGAENSWQYWQSNIQFTFFAIDHSQRGAIQYRYRLGPTKDWTTTQMRSVNFVALPPGNYAFEVQASNKTGQWSSSKLLTFSIQSPFWQTYWFMLMILLLTAAIMYWIYRNRIQQIQSQANLKIQIQELRQSVFRTQMNPHFIFNCLNSIQCYISGNDPVKATHYLAQFAQLIRTILNNGTQTVVPLESDIDLIKTYMELENFRMKYPFEYTLFVQPEIDPFELEIPPLLVQPIVENAILHGLSKLKHPGKLYIGYEQIADDLKVTVMDNGPGVSFNSSAQLLNTSPHQPKGMEIIEKRLMLHQAEKTATTRMRIESLNGVAGWEQGTKVELRIALTADLNSP